MGEFDLIARHLAPLAGPGARGLTDDVASLSGQVVTKDILVEGIHFLATDPIELVARKALRVNLSDLIAKGAQPTFYMLGLVWPKGTPEATFATFACGLKEEQGLSGVTLLGGDTTAGPAMMISITMFGVPGPRGIIGRDGAEPGDALMVTGTIGDGYLGLEAARKAPPANDAAALPYRLPAIPFGMHQAIAQYAKGSLDVSDGLIADAGHLATASGVGIDVDADAVPLSSLGAQERAKDRLVDLVTGGDDYQALFTIDPNDIDHVLAQIPQGVTVTRIGTVTAREPAGRARLLGADGAEIPINRTGWDHFR